MDGLSPYFATTEANARAVRHAAGLPQEGRLNEDLLLHYLQQQHPITVIRGFSQLLGTECAAVEKEIDGFSIPVADHHYIVLNDRRSPERIRATLLEEIAHIVLKHEPSTVTLTPQSLARHRTYNPTQEKEAYALGAALLVPYPCLRRLILDEGATAEDAALHFAVSMKLATYRMQVTYIWRALKHVAAD